MSKGRRLQACPVTHTRDLALHSSPTDGSIKFCQGVILVQILKKGGFIQVQ